MTIAEHDGINENGTVVIVFPCVFDEKISGLLEATFYKDRSRDSTVIDRSVVPPLIGGDEHAVAGFRPTKLLVKKVGEAAVRHRDWISIEPNAAGANRS